MSDKIESCPGESLHKPTFLLGKAAGSIQEVDDLVRRSETQLPG